MNDLVIYGEGKGKHSHTPIETDDTLFSTQTIKILLAVSEGEIEAIDEVYLNKVPFNANNFKGSIITKTGTSNQTKIPGFIDTEAPLPSFVTTEIKENVDFIASIPSDVEAIRITLSLDSLKHYTGDGDLVGTSIALAIDLKNRVDNGTYVQVQSVIKSGKASSVYAWDIMLKRPLNYQPGVDWGLRIRRLTPDSTSIKTENKTRIVGITQIWYKVHTYPRTALVAITLKDADQFGGRAPEVLFKGRFRKVKIPSNYNAKTRVYAGVWNGSFNPVLTFTDNIAWCLLDVLNSDQCLNIPIYEIDISSFYNLAKYADELIPDGKGNQIPRYTIGGQFYTRENVPTLLADFLSICNGILTENNFGQIAVIFDQPNMQATHLFTNANVIDGLFNYSSSDLENRFTQVNVTYNDKNSFGATNTASIPSTSPTTFENNLITRYGLQITDIALAGCTEEAQAIRKARWALYTNTITTKIISFKILFQAFTLKIGQLFKVLDSDNAMKDQHGLIISYSYSTLTAQTTLTIDRAIDLENVSYTITFAAPDAITLITKPILETNTTTTSFTFNGTGIPFIGGVFILASDQAPAVIPQLFRVTSITKDTDSYIVTGLEYDEGKFDYINSNIVLPDSGGDFVSRTDLTTIPVENIIIEENSTTTTTNVITKLHVHWSWDTNRTQNFKALFIATWRRDNQNIVTINQINGQSFDIDNAVPGTYEITVWAVNPFTGIKSTPVIATLNYRTSGGTSILQPPTNARITGKNPGVLVYDSATMSLSFDYDLSNDNVTTTRLYDYIVGIYTLQDIIKGTFIVKPDTLKNGIFKLTLVDNENYFGTPTRQYKIKVYSRDAQGYLSSAMEVIVNNTLPGAPSFTLLQGIGITYVSITPPADKDVIGYIIYRDITPNPTTVAYDGPDTYISIGGETGTLYYYKVAAYDSFDKTVNLANLSQQSGQTLTTDAITWAISGITFSTNSPGTNQISWTGGVIFSSLGSSYVIVAGSATWTNGILYIYFNSNISTTVLQTTNTLAIAVGANSFPIATYQGANNLKGGDGSAFISGSQIIAGTVGASQLIAGTAVITGTAQIASGIIANSHLIDSTIDIAKISNTIQSTNWSAIQHTGWKADKTGDLTTYGAFKAYNNSNQLMFDASGMDGTYIKNATIATASIKDANITTLKVAGQAFSFGLFLETTTTASAAVDTYCEIGRFTAAIEYNSLLELDAQMYVSLNAHPTFPSYIPQTDYYVEVSVFRNFDGALVGSNLIGKTRILGLGGLNTAPYRVVLTPYLVTNSALYAISSLSDLQFSTKSKFPPMIVTGTGETTARLFIIKARLVTIAGTIVNWPAVNQLTVGNMSMNLTVLKR